MVGFTGAQIQMTDVPSVVGLTEVGKQLIQKALPDHIAMVESAFSVMTEEEQLVLIDLLKSLNLFKKGTGFS